MFKSSELLDLGDKCRSVSPTPDQGVPVKHDLAELNALLAQLRDLPPVLDDSEGPALVKASDVARLVNHAATITQALAGRLERYAQTKVYARQLERVVASQQARLQGAKELFG